MKKLRVMVLTHKDLVPPEDTTGIDVSRQNWVMEYDVITALKKIGHEVCVVGVLSDLNVIRRAIAEFKPQIAFNLLEEFDGEAVFDQHVVAYLELIRVPYTGCNPRGMLLARDKALSKQILSYHRIPVPKFTVFSRDRAIRKPKVLVYPLFVKSLVEDASLGIAQSSIVYNDEKLVERVNFIHQNIGTDALVESYIPGRELYVSMMGNQRLEVFPVWELLFTKSRDEIPNIATSRVKWDLNYQKKYGIKTTAAEGLSDDLQRKIRKLCVRVYRVLGLNGYARIDLRLGEDGKIFVLEANPNPNLDFEEDFAAAAAHAGIEYHQLLTRILNLGLRWR